MKVNKNSIYFDHRKSDNLPNMQLLFDKLCHVPPANSELTKLQSDPNYLQWSNLTEDNFYIIPSINIKSDCTNDSDTDCQTVTTLIANKKYYRYDISTADKYILPVPIYAQQPVFFYLWEIFQLYDIGLKSDNPIGILVVTDSPTFVTHNDKLVLLPDILYCVQENRRRLTTKTINDANQMVCITNNTKDINQEYIQMLFVRNNITKILPTDNLILTNKSDLIICWLSDHKFILPSLRSLNLNGNLIFYLETDLNCVNSHSELINYLTYYFSKIICYIPKCAESKVNFMVIICQKLLVNINMATTPDIPKLPHIINHLEKFVTNQSLIVNIAIQKISEMNLLFNSMTKKTWLLHIFHVKNLQISFAETWCKEFKMKIHPFYAMRESEPVLSNDSINFSKIFPYKEGVDRNKLMMTDIGFYSITPALDADNMVDLIAKHITTKPLNELVITESNGGLGGNTLAFAKKFLSVNTAEYSNLHCDILRHNINLYGYSNVNLFCTSYLNVFEQLKQDVVFMDPPWFGPGYKYVKKLYLYVGEYLVEDIINIIKNRIKLLVLKVPFNYDIDYFKKKVEHKNLVIYKIKNYQMLIVDFY